MYTRYCIYYIGMTLQDLFHFLPISILRLLYIVSSLTLSSLLLSLGNAMWTKMLFSFQWLFYLIRCVLNSYQFICKTPIHFNTIFSNVFNYVIMPHSGTMEVIFALIPMDYTKYSIIRWVIINLSNFVAFINYLIYCIFSKSAFAAVCYMLNV